MNDFGKYVYESSVLDVLFFLLGALMGIFYGFDGWRGTVKDIDFKQSPRVRNFIWVVGAGFLTFVADLKTLDSTANKERVLLAYLLGFFVFGASVVLGWGLLIATKSAVRDSRSHEAVDSPFSPFLDYLHYGYEYHRQQYEKLASQRTKRESQDVETFLLSYVKKLVFAMAAANSFKLSPESKRDVSVQILRYMCAVVSERSGLQDVEVNANYMLAYPKSQLPVERLSQLRFSFGNPGRYPIYLALEEYAEDKGRESFVLPVEPKNGDGATMSLPGGPLAFLKNDTVVEDDTQKIRFAKKVPPNVVREMREYFESKNFRSFGSLNIVGQGKQLGIVNIESNLTHVLGRTREEKKQIMALLHPFCLLLGEVIKRQEGNDV